MYDDDSNIGTRVSAKSNVLREWFLPQNRSLLIDGYSVLHTGIAGRAIVEFSRAESPIQENLFDPARKKLSLQ